METELDHYEWNGWMWCENDNSVMGDFEDFGYGVTCPECDERLADQCQVCGEIVDDDETAVYVDGDMEVGEYPGNCYHMDCEDSVFEEVICEI